MNWREAEQAFDDAEHTLRAADTVATRMARVLVGRLRKVDSAYALKQLKYELRDFDSRTGEWRKPS